MTRGVCRRSSGYLATGSDVKGPEDRPTDKDSSSSHRDCRGNVHPRSNAAVRVNLSLTADRSDDLRQRASATDRQTTAPTMGGYH